MRICAVIPAAGRGSRLGLDVPKILAPIKPGYTIWDVLKQKLLPLVDHVHVILSPAGLPQFQAMLHADPDRAFISIGLQEVPLGMGDAIFCGLPIWRKADDILVIWSDQLHVSSQTLRASKRAHLAGRRPLLTLPLVSLEAPYVEYKFDEAGRLLEVLQSREGDQCTPGGLGDVGTFLLSTAGLAPLWRAYHGVVPSGASTGECNFLPFLVFLSNQGWTVKRIAVTDSNEARGINTRSDLEFFRTLYAVECPS